MSSNSFVGCTDSIYSCLTSFTTSSTLSSSDYKEYHFKPESNPDIKSEIKSFWEHLEEANISVPQSNYSKFTASTAEYLKDFQVPKKRVQIVKGKSFDTKWCDLLQLMSRRGLDKLAMKSVPKPCGFCKNESFSATYADENCYDMVVEIEEAKTEVIKTENIIDEEEIQELTVDDEEEKESIEYTSNYDDEIRKLIKDYERMKKSIEMYDDQETDVSEDTTVEDINENNLEDAVSLNSRKVTEDTNIVNEGDINEEVRNFFIIKKAVVDETVNINKGILEILKSETKGNRNLYKEETSANMEEKKYEEVKNTDKESVRVIMKITQKKELKNKKIKHKRKIECKMMKRRK